MEKAEAINMMERCRDEIRDLRATIERMAPKAEAWDQMCKVLNMMPSRMGGHYVEDLVGRLDRRISELLNEPVAAAPTIYPDDAGGGA